MRQFGKETAEHPGGAFIKGKLPIILILVMAAFLYTWEIWEEGFANLYYSAGVYSMGRNFHAFFFNSFDSAGFISIDKPPLGFWIQVLFTKILGFSGVAVLLPQALAGVLSVYLLYRIIRERFSERAGLVAALVLSLTPIYAAISRNNTIDGLLILLLILASQQALLAAEKPRGAGHLALAGVFIGLGFNVKTLQAVMIVPAVYLTYLVFAKTTILRRILNTLLSASILLALSFSWILAVDLTPAAERPYVGSSGDNSELSLTFGYNGIFRLLGRSRPDGGSGEQLPPPGDIGERPLPGGGGQQLPPPGGGEQTRPQQPSGSGGESGPASAFRLLTVRNAGQIAWFVLPAFVFSLIFIGIMIRRKWRTDRRAAAMFYFAMCFLPMLAYFSFAGGLAHRYYFAMLAFPAAALIAAGLEILSGMKKYGRPALLAVFMLTASAQLYIQILYKGWLAWLPLLCGGLFTAAAAVLAADLRLKLPGWIPASMLSVLLILPGLWSLTPILYGDNAQLPVAGPELKAQDDMFDRGERLSGLISYLEEHREGAVYLAAVPSAMDPGAVMILESGEAVMALGGFNGSDSPLTLEEFKSMAAQGKVRYAVLTGSGKTAPGGQQSELLQWIETEGEIVQGDFGRLTLYRLPG